MNHYQSDLEQMLQYSFVPNTKEALIIFYQAKEKYRQEATPENLYWMKFHFQHLHASLKAERSFGTISVHKLEELTDFVLRK